MSISGEGRGKKKLTWEPDEFYYYINNNVK